MELRCFLVPSDGLSASCPYVDITPPPTSPSANQHQKAVKVLGRHSTGLYWVLGNKPHYSRRMMSFWIEDAGLEEVPLTDRVHPQLGQRLMLKSIGKNTLTVSRRTVELGHGNQSGGEDRVFLRPNDSVSLCVGDRVGVEDRVWLRVVLALVSVNDAVKVPLVTPQRCDDAALPVPACRALCPPPRGPPLPPVVCVDRPWGKLPAPLRSSLVDSVWRCQQEMDPGVMVPERAVLSGMGQVVPSATEEVGDRTEEAAAISNDSQAFSATGERRTKRTRHASSSDGHTADSHVLSLDAASSPKKCRTSVAGGVSARLASSVPAVENNTYNDTCDEPLYDDLRVLELRAAVANQPITTGPPLPVVLGESPPREARSGGPKKRSQRDKCVTVSRTQLRHGDKEQGQKQQLPPDHEGMTRNQPAGEESQVVYYGR